MKHNKVLCPKCGSPMQLKKAFRGKNAGGQFYGCVRFPSCRGTRPYSDNIVKSISASSLNVSEKNKKNVPLDANNDMQIMDQATANKIANLIRYYRECVQIESLNEVELYESEENNDFIQCPQNVEWLSSGKEAYELENEEGLKNFGKNLRFKRKQANYFYAYPVYVHHFTRRNTNAKSASVLPFLIFPVTIERSLEKIEIRRSENFIPQINTKAFDKRDVSLRPEQKKFLVQKIMENWDDDNNFEVNLRRVIHEIKEELGDSSFMDPDLEGLSSKAIDILNVEPGFYATGILFISHGSNYTYGLEEELGEIEKMIVGGSISMPIITALLERRDISASKENEEEQLVEIVPLNDEQREVVRGAFRNTLTVVTGPPGTGKSQVVINIIANAVARNENVLFGSKNHQAVNVVLQRIDQVQEQPIILKFGQNARESLFAQKLLNSVDNISGLDTQTLKSLEKEYSSELNRLAANEHEIWVQINECYKSRNYIDKLDLLISSIEERLPDDIIKLIRKNTESTLTLPPLEKLSRYRQELHSGKLSLISKILNIFGVTVSQRTEKEIKRILDVADSGWGIKEIFLKYLLETKEALKVASYLCESAELLKLYRQCHKLRMGKSAHAEKLIDLESQLDKMQKHRYSISPEYIDILMKSKLKNLGLEVRRDIADYEATVKRIEEDRIGGELVEGLRKQKKGLFNSVAKVFPAIAVTNLSVRHAIPLTPCAVDLVVIDEASQCDIASALPMLMRAKRAVIIGDEKQLTHVSNMSKVDDQQIQSRHNLVDVSDQRFLYSSQSLFDLCKSTVGSSAVYVTLRDHYRSRAEIIDFSNKAFYGNQLRVWTDYRQLKQTGKIEGICWHDIIGETIRPSGGSAFNIEEAKKVAEVLKQILPRALEVNATIGIVTPFREQENKIKEIVFKNIPLDKLEAVDLRIDTAHGYQGDERDIMIFSPVVSRGMVDRTKGFLLNTQNLFNVAITRPRAELHIVGDKMSCSRCGVEYLERFMRYAVNARKIERFESGRYAKLFDSPWEEIFYNRLKEVGIDSTPQLAIQQYKLDLAIQNNNPPIDIEIDGEAYHREITGERCMSDIKRDMRLNILGWVVKRFWVYQLKYDLNGCVHEIKKIINKQVNK